MDFPVLMIFIFISSFIHFFLKSFRVPILCALRRVLFDIVALDLSIEWCSICLSHHQTHANLVFGCQTTFLVCFENDMKMDLVLAARGKTMKSQAEDFFPKHENERQSKCNPCTKFILHALFQAVFFSCWYGKDENGRDFRDNNEKWWYRWKRIPVKRIIIITVFFGPEPSLSCSLFFLLDGGMWIENVLTLPYSNTHFCVGKTFPHHFETIKIKSTEANT